MMGVVGWVLVAWMVLEGIGAVALIGKDRGVRTPQQTLLNIAAFATIVLLALHTGG